MTLLKRHILSRKIGSKATKHADLSATGRKGKTMNKEKMRQNIIRNGGVYDTKKYRYIIETTTGDIYRVELCKLGTTEMLDTFGAWKKV